MSSFEEKYDYAMEMAAALTRDRDELRVKYDEALARASAAEAVARVRALHVPCTIDTCGKDAPESCHACASAYPCATIGALDGVR